MSVIRRNMFPNAACEADGTQPTQVIDVRGNTLSWRWGGQYGFCMETKEGTSGSYVAWALNIADCEGKPMVFACDVGYASTMPARGDVIQVINSSGERLAWIPAKKPENRSQLLRFTMPNDGKIELRFRGPQWAQGEQNMVAFYKLQLELASTFDNRGDTPAYFNGFTFAGGIVSGS